MHVVHLNTIHTRERPFAIALLYRDRRDRDRVTAAIRTLSFCSFHRRWDLLPDTTNLCTVKQGARMGKYN